ncbi:MAG: PAS domain S-box protein [Candidatus Natronoplasma sp.]
MKILYVDDEEDKREQTKTFLEQSNDDFDVDTASSVEQGLEKLEKEDYQIIVSDYDMSPRDGLEFLEEVRESGKDLPFIMLTGKGREEVAMEALNLGADRYIRRHGDSENLYEFLSRVVTQEFEHYEEKRKRRLQETYFQDLFETSPEAIVLLDNEDRIIEANRAFERIFQYDRECIKREKINDLIVPDEKTNEATTASNNVLSGDSIMIETQREKKDGSMIDVSILGYPIEFEDEQVGVFGIYRDISERKERERKIKKLYHTLSKMERCNSEDEVFDFVLKAAKEILDFKSSSIMIAEGDYLVTKKVIAENVDVGDKEPIDEGIRGLTYQNKKYYLVEDLDEWEEAKPTDPDFKSAISIPIGEEGVFQALSYEKGYFDEFDLEMAEGLIFHTVQILEGIKSRKKIQKSEEKYRTIFQCADDAIFVIKDYTFVDCNEKTTEMFDMEREDILTRPPWEFSPKNQLDGKKSEKKAKEKIDKAIKGEPQFFEWVHKKSDGTEFYTEVNLNRYKMDEENYVMAVVRDITERKKTKKELEVRNQKIKKMHDKATEFDKCDSEEEICELVIEASEEILDFNVCGIDFVEGGEFIPIALSSDIEEGFIRRKVEEAGISRKVYQEKESLLIEDRREIDFSKPVVSDYRSSITIPLGDFGIYQTLSTEVGKFNEKDMELAEILVNHAAEAIGRLRFQEALMERNEKIKSLHKKAAEFEKYQTEEEIFRHIVDTAKRILNFEVCSLDIVENGEFEVKATIGGLQEEGTRYPIEGIAGKTYRSGESFLITDLDEEEKAKPKRETYKSAISVPVGGYGVLQVLSEEKNDFDEKDLELTEILVTHGSEAIGRLRFENALIEKNRKIKRIHDTAIEMEKCDTEDEVLELSLEAVEEVLDIYDYTLALMDEEEDEFVIKESFRGEYENGSTLPKDLGYLGKSFKERSSYVIDDILEDDIAEPAIDKYRSAISLPIGNLGVFQTMSTEVGYYDEDDLEMLETLFSHTYQVIKRIEGEEEIRRSKNRYRAIFENTGTATTIIEKDGTISLANKKADRLAGLYEDTVEGEKYEDFVVEEDRERIKRYHKSRLKDPESVSNEYDFQLKTKDGEVKDVHVSLNLIPGSKEVVASFVDITDKKRMKKTKNRLQSLIRKIEDDFERFETYIDSLNLEKIEERDRDNIENIKELVRENLSKLEDE